MHDLEKKKKFIELRSIGVSYRNIAKQLGVNKDTLVNWNFEFYSQISVARQMEIEDVLDEMHIGRIERIRHFAHHFKEMSECLDGEFGWRDNTKILGLMLKYDQKLTRETEMAAVPPQAPAAEPPQPKSE